ncbi:YL1 nuclear protein-domain-containing protein [Apiosordaria backusii]|uniref:YL1 nuclear protein-domain-containing protein n=1 Tax=Apiosordaria backusii TaxID=314023 RepID=A0AA40F0B9_9PEZI|nr:YL1 nuclear protein-domain-containing protein [Apiosordaria backusii]
MTPPTPLPDEVNSTKPSTPALDSLSSSSDDSDSDIETTSHKKSPPQQTAWLATSRSKRSTAGNRMKALLANETPLAPSGADQDSDELELLFAEDEDDAGFTDDAREDASDVQMDSSSDEEDQDAANADDDEGEKELERQAREKRAAQRKRKAQEAIPAKFRKKVRIEPPGSSNAGSSTVASPAPKPPRPKKKSERASWLPTQADMPTRASERSTTRMSKQQLHEKMVTDEIRRKKQLERMEKKAKLLEAMKKPPMTQAERLAEAAKVEKRNAKSLNRWEEAEKQREEERLKKIAALNSRKLDGPVVTFWSGIQELSEGQGKHVGNLVSMEEKAPRKKRQSVAAALAAKEAGANGEPTTPTTPVTPVNKDKLKLDGEGVAKVKPEKTDDQASGTLPVPPEVASSAPNAAAPENTPAVPAAVATPGTQPPLSVPVTAPPVSVPVSTPAPPVPAAASKPPAVAPVLMSAPAPIPAAVSTTLPPAALAPPVPATTTISPPVVTPAPAPSMAPPAPPSMAPPPIPPPPEVRPPTSGVLAAPILAPPPGPMLGAQMPMLSFPSVGGKSNVLALPNTTHTPSPLSMPPAAPAVPTPAPPKPMTAPNVSVPVPPSVPKLNIPPPPLPSTPVPSKSAPAQTPVSATPVSATPISAAPVSATPMTAKPPATPQSAVPQSATNPEPPQDTPQGKVTRSCIILQNFDDAAIKDKQIQNQILFGRKMNRLAKPAHPPLCVITNHPAKYRDPKTGLHYYNSYAYKEIQRVSRGDYKWSSLLGAYVGRGWGEFAAKEVPERFRDPSKPSGIVKKLEVVEARLVPIEGVEPVVKGVKEVVNEVPAVGGSGQPQQQLFVAPAAASSVPSAPPPAPVIMPGQNQPVQTQ